MDTLLQKPRTSRARMFVSLTFTTLILLGVCPDLFAHAPKANLKGDHLRLAVLPEDVYFNADGRQVSATTSLAEIQKVQFSLT